jgi:hypothetical protein
MSENTAPTPSPFAAPAAPAPAPAPASAPTTSPFAAPAQPGPAATEAPTPDLGDTSYLDTVPATEPLIKACTVPGIIRSFEIKSGQSGDDYISMAVQVYGDNMVNERGEPVAPGKRLTTMLFPFSKNVKEQVDRKGRDLRNLLFALYNIPLDGNEMKAFATWPREQKPGVFKPKDMADGSQRIAWSLYPFQPASKWLDKKVMVQVRKGTDMDGNPKNEFSLLAESTKPTARKGAK